MNRSLLASVGALIILLSTSPTAAQPLQGMPVRWETGPVLDQGVRPYCVSYALMTYLLSGPSPLRSVPWADDIQQGTLRPDGTPDPAPYRTTVVDWALAHTDRLYLTRGFLRSTRLSQADGWLSQGPVMLASHWYNSMDSVGPDGYAPVRLDSGIRGQHVVLIYGRDAEGNYLLQNSWGEWWGDKGHFKLRAADMARLSSSWVVFYQPHKYFKPPSWLYARGADLLEE